MDDFGRLPIREAGRLAVQADKRVTQFARLPAPSGRTGDVVAVNAACFLQGSELGIEAFIAFDRQEHPVGLCAEQGEPPGADLLGAARPTQDKLFASVAPGQMGDLAALEGEQQVLVNIIRRGMHDMDIDIAGIADGRPEYIRREGVLVRAGKEGEPPGFGFRLGPAQLQEGDAGTGPRPARDLLV